MNKRALVIGGKLDEKNYFAKIKALGLEVFAVQLKELAEATDLASADEVLICDYLVSKTFAPMIAAAHRVNPFDVAMSLTEVGLLPAAQTSEMLGLPATSLCTVRLLKDKWSMRQHLNALGLSPVRSAIGHDRADLHAFHRSLGGPLIAKPIDGSGSCFIVLIRHERDIELGADAMQRAGLAAFLMEEFLDGREVSVETFSFSGRHVIVAVTEKWTNQNFVEVGHAVPALLHEGELEAIERCVASFLEAVGLMEGPAHTEIKLTSVGPKIIESHNRIGGDRINELVRVAYGVDMISMTYERAFDLGEPLTRSPVAHGAAAIRFIIPEPGLISSISGTERVRQHPAVVELELEKRVGDRVGHAVSSDHRCGHVVVRATDRDAAVRICENLVETIAIKVIP